MGKTNIAWTDYTLNPWHGCTKVSEGCRNCYAETLSHRFGNDVWGNKPRKMFDATSQQNQLKSWNEKARKEGTFRRVFIGSMMDIFDDHPSISNERRLSLLNSLPGYKNLVFLLLTKRIENAYSMLPYEFDWPKNVRVGCTIEDERTFSERIDHVLKFPLNFISFEPLLSEISQSKIKYAFYQSFRYSNIQWAIIGGESGPKARPFNPNWIDPFIALGEIYHVPVFVKQMGSAWAKRNGAKSSKGEDMSEWHEYHQLRQFPIEPRELTPEEKEKTLVHIWGSGQ